MAAQLVAQHPLALPDSALRELSALTGQPPRQCTASCARWVVTDPAAAALDRARIRALALQLGVDLNVLAAEAALEHYALAVFDMDSTLITIECIDEIADFAGLKPQVAAITEAAMRGDIRDFRESLARRVALLKGLPQSVLQRVHDERLQLSPGAEALLDALRSAGLSTLLVSGGFTFFTERVRARLGIDAACGNVLGVDAAGALDGSVVPPIVDAVAKRDWLLKTCTRLGIEPARALAVGDGANDLQMMSAAGLSVAFRAKPAVRIAADVAIDVGGLDALVELLTPPR